MYYFSKISGNTPLLLSLKSICVHSKAIISTNKCIRCTLIQGDGQGPELCNAVRKVFRAARVPIKFDTIHQSESLENIIYSIRKTKVCLNKSNWNLKITELLECYAKVVHIKSFTGVRCRHAPIDMSIIRNYSDTAYLTKVKGIDESIKTHSQTMIDKIAKFAFEFAIENNKRILTVVHKAISDIRDDIFLTTCLNLSTNYTDIDFQYLPIGNCAMKLRRQPQHFEILVTPYMYGSMIEKIGACLVGDPTMVTSSYFSSNCAIFEPEGRYSYYTALDKNTVNPTGMLLSSVNLLNHVGLKEYSILIENAICKVYEEGKYRTKDVGGICSTCEFIDAVIEKLDLGAGLFRVPHDSSQGESFINRVKLY